MIQIIQLNTKMKWSLNLNEDIEFWIWKRSNLLVLITQTSVVHFNVQRDLEPRKIFERHHLLDNFDIKGYCIDSKQQWAVLFGFSEIDGAIQLYSSEQKVSQAFKGSIASIAEIKVGANIVPTTLFIFIKQSKLHITELSSSPASSKSFLNRTANMTFSHTDQLDFPVS